MELPGIKSMSGIDLRAMASASAEAEIMPRVQANKRREQRLETEQAQFMAVYKAAQALSQSTRALLSEAEKVSLGYSLNVSSSAPEQISVRHNHQTMPGVWHLTVKQMASSHSLVSNPLTNQTVSEKGTLSIASNGDIWRVNLFPGRTLMTLAKAIQLSTGGQIQSTVINSANGQHLMLTASEEGLACRIHLSGNGSGEKLAETFKELTPPRDAELVINGMSVALKGNSEQSVITGIKLDIHQATPDQPVTISALPDHSSLTEALQTFIDHANQLRQSCDPRDENGLSLQSGGASLKNLGEQLRRILSGYSRNHSGATRSLTDLGISTNRQGQWVLDQTHLQQTLTHDPQKVINVLLNSQGPVQNTERLLLSASGYQGSIVEKATYLSRQLQALARNQQQTDIRQKVLMDKHLKSFSKMDSSVASNRQLKNSLADLGNIVTPDRRSG